MDNKNIEVVCVPMQAGELSSKHHANILVDDEEDNSRLSDSMMYSGGTDSLFGQEVGALHDATLPGTQVSAAVKDYTVVKDNWESAECTKAADLSNNNYKGNSDFSDESKNFVCLAKSSAIVEQSSQNNSSSKSRVKKLTCRVPSIPTLIVSDITGKESCLLKGISPDCAACADTSEQKNTFSFPSPNCICSSLCVAKGHPTFTEELSMTHEHRVLSSRHSYDSAYGSCMDSASSFPLDETISTLPLSVEESAALDNEENGGGVFTCSDETQNYSSLPFSLLLPDRSISQCSSTSSVSDAGLDAQNTDDSCNLRIDSEDLARKHSFSSNLSLRSTLSLESEEDNQSSDDISSNPLHSYYKKKSKKAKAQNSWTKLRRIVIWSPFMQSFKKDYPWVQLAGHAGNFQPGEEGCILKKYCQREAEYLEGLTSDPCLCEFAPTFHGIVELHEEKYVRMQDLLLHFESPALMDCKMGVRTYLEDELVTAKVNPRPRHDMYKKMIEISPNEPTDEEKRRGAITKPRYMQWREKVSSTSNLGFRIEGIKKCNRDPSKGYKLTKSFQQVVDAFKYFIDDNTTVLEKYIERLKNMREALEGSNYFHSHEAIGSSLLFVHDSTGLADVWMIDFGKTTRLPDNQRLDHRSEWIEGNREDGYLFGMDNILRVYEAILEELKPQEDFNFRSTPPRDESVRSDVTSSYVSTNVAESDPNDRR